MKIMIDFLTEEPAVKPSPPVNAPPPKNKIWLYFLVFISITIIGFSTKIIISSTEASRNFAGGGVLSQLKNLIVNHYKKIDGAKDNRINLLLMGIGGPDHDGPYLTDTIILASIQPKTQSVALISIPRDLYITDQTYGGIKINSLYALNRSRGEAESGQLMKQAVGDLFGIPIHYYAVIDFQGFIDFIDVLGGVNVTVDRSFCDNQFPGPRYSFRSLCFEAGEARYGGEQALQYARSRHGNNGEGSDFARAKRQQKIMLAVKNKMLTLGILLRPDKIDKMLNVLGQNIKTDMELWEVMKLADLVKKADQQNVVQKVLDDAPNGWLRATTGRNGAFLLIPKDLPALRAYIQNIFTFTEIAAEAPRIIIQNGTTVPGLALTTRDELEPDGFVVTKAENALKQSYAQTVIYDLTAGAKPASLAYLQTKLEANIASYVPTDLWATRQDADFIIILGEKTL